MIDQSSMDRAQSAYDNESPPEYAEDQVILERIEARLETSIYCNVDLLNKCVEYAKYPPNTDRDFEIMGRALYECFKDVEVGK
jgi:uncharacterized protein YutE (UPF0331/DUF86 family)